MRIPKLLVAFQTYGIQTRNQSVFPRNSPVGTAIRRPARGGSSGVLRHNAFWANAFSTCKVFHKKLWSLLMCIKHLTKVFTSP